MRIGSYQINELPRSAKIFTPRILANRDWYEKNSAAYLHPLSVVGLGCVLILHQRVRNTFRFGIIFAKHQRTSWFWDGRDIVRLRKYILRLAITRPEKIKKWKQEWLKDWRVFKAVVRRLEQIDIKKLSDSELLAQYQELINAYVTANSLPYLVDSFLSTGDTDWLTDMILAEIKNKVDEKDLSETLAKLTATVNVSFSQREHIELLVLAKRLARIKPLVKRIRTRRINWLMGQVRRYPRLWQLLRNHARKYYWIENSYYQAVRLDEVYFLKKIVDSYNNNNIESELKKYRNLPIRNQRVKNALLLKLNISPNLRTIIHLSEDFALWQDTRKSGVFIANHFIFRFLDEIARRVRIPKKEMYNCVDLEIKDILLRRKFNRRTLQRRDQGSIFVYTSGGFRLLEGRAARSVNRKIFYGESKTLEKFRGVSASPGRVIGRVRIIYFPSELRQIKVGEILVANNTTPDFVPAMRRAAAVVTEQGGITCHAAVVSRELGIPCVIGTKIATKVLKDGDLVEVDATKGIVRKI